MLGGLEIRLRIGQPRGQNEKLPVITTGSLSRYEKVAN